MTLKKITNFRSLGGYQNAHGQMVKDGLIFRSGQLFELEDDQSQYLGQTLGIKHIVDMRSDDERTEFPDTVWEGRTMPCWTFSRMRPPIMPALGA